MTKLFWNTLKLSPVLLGATLLLANRTQAAAVLVPELAPNSFAAATSLPTSSLEPVVSSLQLLAQSATSVPARSASNKFAAFPVAKVDPEVKLTDLRQPSPMQQQVADKPAQSAISQNFPAPDTLAQKTSSQLSTQAPDILAQSHRFPSCRTCSLQTGLSKHCSL